MGAENHGAETTQEQEAAQERGNEQAAQEQQEVTAAAGADWEKQIAERDARIAELEGQVAEAAKNAETAESLRGEIAELKAQGESDRIDFRLQFAGVRNVKAARALLGDHGNDIDKLKEAEPWLFEPTGKHAAKGGTGTTGLPNAGAANDSGKQLRHFREVAGLSDDTDSTKTKKE